MFCNPPVMEKSVFCCVTCPMPECVQVAVELLSCVPDSDKGWQDAPGTPGNCCGSCWLVRPRYNPTHGSQYSHRELGSVLWRRSGEWTCKHCPALNEVGGISLTLALPGQKGDPVVSLREFVTQDLGESSEVVLNHQNRENLRFASPHGK